MQAQASGVAAAIPTYRAYIDPSLCDVMGHFTIAHYFGALEHANRAALAGAGVGLPAPDDVVVTRCHLKFMKEMVAGQHFDIASEVAATSAAGITLQHRLFCTTSEVPTTEAQCMVRPRFPLDHAAAVRGGQDAELAAAGAPPGGDLAYLSGVLDSVTPAEMSASGRLCLAAYVHRFSASALRCLEAIGIDQAYIVEQRRGFSTIALELVLHGAPCSGDLLEVESAVAKIGSSSIRLVHRMRNRRTGALVATLDQAGVHLNLEARRSEQVPELIRGKAGKLALASATAAGGRRA